MSIFYWELPPNTDPIGRQICCVFCCVDNRLRTHLGLIGTHCWQKAFCTTEGIDVSRPEPLSSFMKTLFTSTFFFFFFFFAVSECDKITPNERQFAGTHLLSILFPFCNALQK